ncbi:hypothetical protein Tco_0010386 [Tanacetum coccineum]
MANLKFADTHNMVAFLAKPAKSERFEQIVDFLNTHTIKYALTINPTIYTSCNEQFWATVMAKTVNGEVQLQDLVDGKKIIITESVVRRDLQLEDAKGVDCLPNATIFEQLTLMGKQCVVRRVTAVTIPVSAATTTTTITDVEMTLAQALAELKNAKPKANKVLAQDTEQKVIIHESRACTYTNCFFKNHHIGLKIVVDYQLAQRLQAQEQNELTDEEKARLFVQFLEQKRKHFAAKRSEEKRNRPPTRA